MSNFNNTFAPELVAPAKKYRKVSRYALIKAFQFLFPNRNIPNSDYEHDELFRDIEHFVQNKHMQTNCAVLYAINKEFNAILKKHGEDIGRKEVKIVNGVVLTTLNYSISPKP